MAELNFRKRGTKWEYRFEGASMDGKRNQISKGGFLTKAECSVAGIKALNEYNSAGLHFVPSEMSFSDYLDYWLEQYCKIDLKDTTYKTYKKKINYHIRPKLGIYKLKALSAAVIQGFISAKFNEGYSRNTIAVIKGILSGSLGYAVEPLAFIQINPARLVKLPSTRAMAEIPTRKKEKIVISKEQINMILSHFPEGHYYHLPLLLAYRCGLRLGETFALTWEDVNFEDDTLDISKQVQMQGKSWTFSNPKYDSFRVIKFDLIMRKALLLARERHFKNKEDYGEHYICIYEDADRCLNALTEGIPKDMLCSRENGSYAQPRIMMHCSSVIHHKLGFSEFDYHSLRHTHATMLLESGANIKAIQHRLGHKNVNVTLQIYAHVTDRMQDDTINILNSIL